jgi:hypothetical protein
MRVSAISPVDIACCGNSVSQLIDATHGLEKVRKMVRTVRLAAPIAGKQRASVEGWTVDRQGDWRCPIFGRSLDGNRQWKRSGDVGSSKDKEE